MSNDKERIKELEKKIEALEGKFNDIEKKDRHKTMIRASSNFIGELVTRSDDAFQRLLLNKYSEENLPEGSKHLDFSKALEKVKGKKNSAEKLRYWRLYKHSLGNRNNLYWAGLQHFVDKAISYYEQQLVKYILNEGKYMESGGRKKEINRALVIDLWNRYRTNPAYVHKSGRYEGKPKKDKIYDKIASDINMQSAIRTIREIINNGK